MNKDFFLAICKDRLDDPNGFYYTVYFANNSNQTIEDIHLKTGGFCSMDDELVNLVPAEKEFHQIIPFSSVEIEIDDEGAFDFVIWFQLTITIAGKETKINFDIPKYLMGLKKVAEIPILDKSGYVINATT